MKHLKYLTRFLVLSSLSLPLSYQSIVTKSSLSFPCLKHFVLPLLAYWLMLRIQPNPNNPPQSGPCCTDSIMSCPSVSVPASRTCLSHPHICTQTYHTIFSHVSAFPYADPHPPGCLALAAGMYEMMTPPKKHSVGSLCYPTSRALALVSTGTGCICKTALTVYGSVPVQGSTGWCFIHLCPLHSTQSRQSNVCWVNVIKINTFL